jgi:tetratricopeptide (TPR) repeat protein
MYYTTLADLFVKQKKYAEAINPLEKALEKITGKKPKYRLTYLLAQLNEESGNAAKATALYRNVVNMNPPYEVEFNARINIAGVFDINYGDPVELKKELERMLRDSKNKDFQDQIYYALGNMSLKEGKEADAVEYFRKSVNSISPNQNQKGRSYMALADLYYKKKDYMKAGMFYDSTVYFLDRKHPDYQVISKKSQNLNALVTPLSVIQREDSLQRIALMDEPQRNGLIAQVIATVIQQESNRNSSEYQDRYNIGEYYENERRSRGNIEQEGKWYFYNQSALAFGRTEFRRRWGDRKLEDNWRRSNKARVNTSQLADNGDSTQQNAADTGMAKNNNRKPEYYLKDLPLTDSLMALSNERISTAQLDAAKAYYERIADTAMATETLEQLINRFPESPLVPEALYNLYNINKQKNSIKAEAYRQRLLERFPESEFGRILSDPSYFEKKMADIKITELLYEEAYNNYSAGLYNDAITQTASALEKYPRNELAPKFLLLHAYAVAAVSDERKFREELSSVVKTWPGTPESKKAEELISYLNQKLPELKIEEDKKIAEELFVKDTTAVHSFALIIGDASFNINQATFDVISYNLDNYTNQNFKTEGTLIDNNYLMINVSGFRSYSEAMDYYGNFNVDKIVRNTTGKTLMTFVINEENMKVLLKDRNPDRYRLFFIKNYLK